MRLYLWQRALRDVHSAFEPQLVMEGRFPRGVTTLQEQDPSRQLTWVTVTASMRYTAVYLSRNKIQKREIEGCMYVQSDSLLS